MRGIVSVVWLAVAIGTVPAGAQDSMRPAIPGPVPRLEMRAAAVDAPHERGGLVRRALSALARLRLRPGHDDLERSAITPNRLR